MRRIFAVAALLIAGAFSLLPAAQPPNVAGHAGQPLVIELDNAFIATYADRATITSAFTIEGISKPHPAKSDGEVHVGGWAYEAGLPCVSEVMNVAHAGKKPMLALQKAWKAGQKVTVTGAWRIWGEHAGLRPQIQALKSTPKFPLPGVAPSNPDHVFEIHPVTTFKVGDTPTDATEAIGDTPGFTPHDANTAFVLGYEKATCKILPKGDRTRILTQMVKFNFTQFVIRKEKDVVPLEDGHSVICTVFDTDGDLLVRNRRMVFLKGTAADAQVQKLNQGELLQVIGIPRIDLSLIKWRVDHKDEKNADGSPKYDVSPLEWNLPYEMIIVSAKAFAGETD
jgi:hypothetical protein